MESHKDKDAPCHEPLACTTVDPKRPKNQRMRPRFNLLQSCRPVAGIIFALLSSLSMVTMNTFAKLCLILPPFEIGIFRFVIQLLISIPPVFHANYSLIYTPKVNGLLVLRGVFGASGMLTRFYAVQNMPLGDATVMTFTSPVFTAIFARIFLKERLHWIYSILIVFCLVGATLIARPTFIFGHPDTAPEYDDILVPSLVALLSAACTSCGMVTVRVLIGTHKIPSSVILLYFGLIGLVYSVIGSYFDRGFQFPFCQSIDYLYATLVGVFAHLVQVLLNAALKYEKAFIVALGRSSGIVFGFIFQIIIYSLIPSQLSFGGASIIILCNLVIFVFKWFQSKKH